MSHWQSAHIEQFRRLRDLRLEGLGRVNLLVGRNDSGKTSVLEALAILCNPADPWTWLDIAREREINKARMPPAESLKQFFPHTGQIRDGGLFDTGVRMQADGNRGHVDAGAQFVEFRYEPSQLEARGPSSNEPQLAVRFQLGWDIYGQRDKKFFEFYPDRDFSPHLDHLPHVHAWEMITPVTHRTDHGVLENVSLAVEAQGKPNLIELLGFLEPDLEGLEILSPSGRSPVIKLLRRATGFMPLSAQGDGIRRALAMAAATYFAEGGMLFIDEIETALHVAALEKVFRFLVQACEISNIQLFATTHSLEAIDAIVEAMGGRLNDLVLFQLPAPDGSNQMKRIAGSRVHRIREEEGFDLR